MKKVTILLLALAMLCTCFALAACGDDGETSSAESSADSSAASSATEESSAASSAASSEASSAASSAAASSAAASSEASSETSSATSSGTAAADAQVFWLTHYDLDHEVEGAGIILTETDNTGDWCTHVAFKPVEGETDVWEIAEISLGIMKGGAVKLDVPEGGFVYSINIGNDWPTLYKGDPATYAAQKDEPDYTTQVCTNLGQNIIPTWKVGMKLKIEGLDLTGKTIPTTTPDKKWYDDSSDPYVCTATYTIVG